IAGGNGGAHHTIIESTNVSNFYVLYATDANGACCLSDSNNLIHVSGVNGHIGILLQGTQTYINRIEEPTLQTTVGIKDTFSKSVLVTGGNISASDAVATSFGISGTGNFAHPSNRVQFTTVLSPCGDAHVPNVYTAWTIASANFGIIPMTLV